MKRGMSHMIAGPSEYKRRTEEVSKWSDRKLNTRLAQLKSIILTAQLEKDYILNEMDVRTDKLKEIKK